MKRVQTLIDLILKAVAVGMAVAVIVLGALNATDVNSLVTLLGIGLFALAVAALQKERQSRGEQI